MPNLEVYPMNNNCVHPNQALYGCSFHLGWSSPVEEQNATAIHRALAPMQILAEPTAASPPKCNDGRRCVVDQRSTAHPEMGPLIILRRSYSSRTACCDGGMVINVPELGKLVLLRVGCIVRLYSIYPLRSEASSNIVIEKHCSY